MKFSQRIALISLAAAASGAIAAYRVASQRRWAAERSKAGREIALVTGASSGIGTVFARHLARDGYDLLLTARREERLRALAEELEGQFGVRVEVVPADLSNQEDIERLDAAIQRIPNLALLVNNAGFGTGGKFSETDIQPEMNMVSVHIEASMRLARAALPGMIQRHKGGIINVSSMAGFVPMPGNITYGATKAFLNSFSRALFMETLGTGVRVQALCPGFTYSEFHDVARVDKSMIPFFMWTNAEEVVQASLNGLQQGQALVIPGLINKIEFFLLSLLPLDWFLQWI